jgi:hypothetical protein
MNLFPFDITNIILQYAGNDTIIQLQNDFPHSLKYVLITCHELELINENNYQYIRKFDCNNSNNITDNDIKKLINLTELQCAWCINITDASIQYLTNLTELSCRECHNVTP